jgi:hypothetical protein
VFSRRPLEVVWEQIRGFSGFGFPKAHSAAFGLLAYQSAWLRIHYGPEFLCSLLNEQPMGFYPQDSLVHEAQRRGIRVAPLDANRSRALCHVESPRAEGEVRGGLVVRIGLGYVKGVKKEEMEALVMWVGLEPLGEWGKLIADYRSTGMTIEKHPTKLLCPGLDPKLVRSADLGRVDHGAGVEIAGMVTARQRPETPTASARGRAWRGQPDRSAAGLRPPSHPRPHGAAPPRPRPARAPRRNRQRRRRRSGAAGAGPAAHSPSPQSPRASRRRATRRRPRRPQLRPARPVTG